MGLIDSPPREVSWPAAELCGQCSHRAGETGVAEAVAGAAAQQPRLQQGGRLRLLVVEEACVTPHPFLLNIDKELWRFNMDEQRDVEAQFRVLKGL